MTAAGAPVLAVAGTLAAEVTVMNRVNGVYERDLAMHMNIVANNAAIRRGLRGQMSSAEAEQWASLL